MSGINISIGTASIPKHRVSALSSLAVESRTHHVSVDTKILRTNHHRIAQGHVKWHCMISYYSIYIEDGSWGIWIGLLERFRVRFLAIPRTDMSRTVSRSVID